MQNKLDSKLLDILLDLLATIEVAESKLIDEDFVVEILEFTRAELQAMNQDEKQLLMQKLAELNLSFSKEKQKFVIDFLDDLN